MSSLSVISSISFYLPEERLDNAELSRCFPDWTEEKIVRKLGIECRPIAAADETASDLGVKAAEIMFDTGVCKPEDIDHLIFCTQSPDYFLPSTACVIHERLGLPKSAGAFDINLGCSGYIYGISICKGLIENKTADKILFITSETYSKYINPQDRSSRPLFGDGAACTLIKRKNLVFNNDKENNNNDCNNDCNNNCNDNSESYIGPFVFGTDGSGADLLIVQAGGHRLPKSADTANVMPDRKGGMRSKEQLLMHGPGIFSFAIDRVPPMVEMLLTKSGKLKSDIGCYIFHQANKYMLQRLRELCGLDESKFFNNILNRGNTVSSSIPIAIVDAWNCGMLKPEEFNMLIGFGVGLSWGGTLIKLPNDFVPISNGQ
ncbi:MAG: ketoacyl-ACP synthase III [Planctomycetaceae bacterium]|jgi:3-oxoacyl-[acyl-carrier-protein] synthase-3|nr:ketoacyl-ACP synthase III [Planctomycetaceae bacterium]